MDLLEPLLRPERRVDALGHYHERTSLSTNPTEAYVGRNQLGILTGFYFSHSLQYPSIIILVWEINTYTPFIMQVRGSGYEAKGRILG